MVVSLAPGDPAAFLLTPGMSPDVVAQMRANFGLDDPLPVRYLRWIGALLTGDFGFSYTHGAPVASVLASVLPNTLLLAACALGVSFLLGIAAGVVQAVRRGNGALDPILSVILLFFYSMPSFWLALMLILVFSLMARTEWGWAFWLPASGMHSVDYAFLPWWEKLLERGRYLILPTTSLVLVLTAGVARYTRSGVLEALHQDFVRTARAKGLPERTVVVRHVLRNALLPVVTLVGLYLPFLLSGAVFVEYVFAWPGMGKAVVDAVLARDYPLVMAGSFLFATMVVLGSLVADVLYAVVDPRIRHG